MNLLGVLESKVSVLIRKSIDDQLGLAFMLFNFKSRYCMYHDTSVPAPMIPTVPIYLGFLGGIDCHVINKF